MAPIPQASSLAAPVTSSVAAAVAARSSHRRWASPPAAASPSTPAVPSTSSGPVTPTGNASTNPSIVTPEDERNTEDNAANSAIVISPYSSLASQCIQREEYDQAVQWYQMALKEYCHHSDVGRRRRARYGATPTYGIVELCNAAATCFNLGAVSKKIQKYERAVLYYKQSEKLYRKCVEMVRDEIHRSQEEVESSPRRRLRKLSILSGASSASSSSSPTTSWKDGLKGNHQNKQSTSTTTPTSEQIDDSQNAMKVCLMQLIVETLQTRGHVHYKYQNSIEEAIDCHEEVITLLDIDEDEAENDNGDVENDGDDDSIDKDDNGKSGSPHVDKVDSRMLVERDDAEEDEREEGKAATGSLSVRFRRSPPPPMDLDGDNENRRDDGGGKILISNIWFMITSDAIDPEEKRYELLSMSYQQLGTLYVQHGDVEDGFRAYQEALYILRNRLVLSTLPPTSPKQRSDVRLKKQRDRQQTMAKILCRLSDLYLSRQDMDLAMDSIQDYLEIRRLQREQEQAQDQEHHDVDENDSSPKTTWGSSSLTVPGSRRGRSSVSSVSTSSSSSLSSGSLSALDLEALGILEKLALANEQVGYWDKALNCYERVLLMQSQHFGPQNERVADTLVRLGRVMTFQGNPEGGLDLYLAAYHIYAKNRLLASETLEQQTELLDINEQTLAVVPEDGSVTEEVLKLNLVSKHGRRLGSGAGSQGGDNSINSTRKKIMPLELIQMISRGLVQLGREPEAIQFLIACLDRERRYRILADAKDDDEIEMEERDCHEANVYRELGLTYMELKLYGKASECLVESARLLEGTSNEEQVFGLLQRVEFLQRMDSFDKEEKEDDSLSDALRHISVAASFEEIDSKDEDNDASDDDGSSNSKGDTPHDKFSYDCVQMPYSSHMFVAEESSTLMLENSTIPVSGDQRSSLTSMLRKSTPGLASSDASSNNSSQAKQSAIKAPEAVKKDLEIDDTSRSCPEELESSSFDDQYESMTDSNIGDPDEEPEESGHAKTQFEDGAFQAEESPKTDSSTCSDKKLEGDDDRVEGFSELDVVSPTTHGDPDAFEDQFQTRKDGMALENGSKSTQSTEASLESFSPISPNAASNPPSANVEKSGHDDVDLSPPDFKPINIVQSFLASRSLGRVEPVDESSRSNMDDNQPDNDDQEDSILSSSTMSETDLRPSPAISKMSSTDTDSLPSHYFNIPEPVKPNHETKPAPGARVIPNHEPKVTPGAKDNVVDPQERQTHEISSILQGLSAEELEAIDHRRSCMPKVRTPDMPMPERAVSPAETATSRTGLLNLEAKDVAFESTSSNKASIRMPTLSTKQQKKDKREYAEIEDSKGSSRSYFSKVFSSPFRRATRKRGALVSTLGALEEDREITTPIPPSINLPQSPRSLIPEPHPKQQEMLPMPDDYNPSGAPIPYISASFGDDSASQVSQITFQFDEPVSKQNSQDSGWWWGVTEKGLEGWFQTSYVSQAVEAAEDFLSAKAIHDRVKSRPLDFDSDEESEIEEDEARISKPVDLDDESLGSAKNPPSLDSLKKSSSVKQNRDITSVKESKVPNIGQGNRNVSNASSGTTNFPASTKASGGSSSGGANRNQSLNAEILQHEEILKKQKKDCGSEHVTVAATLFTLSVLHMKNRNLHAAIETSLEALKIQKSLGNLPDAARCLHFLADLHMSQKRYNAALLCYEDARKLQEETFGMFHEEVANTLNRIGNVLARQGEFGLAMEQHQAALLILKECFGEDVKHPLVSHTLIQIGAVYYKERNSLSTIQANVDNDGAYSTFIEGGMLEVIGRAHEDRGSYRMAIAFFEEKLQFLDDKDDSPDLDQVAETLNSLGMLSARAGLYMEAIDYYDRALSIQMKLGCDDVQLGMARVLTGSVQYYLGHYRKALKLFQEGLKILNKNIGSEHETVAATLYQTSLVHAALCEYDSAMASLHEAFDIQIRILGPDHPATLRTRREIGNMFAIYKAELPTAFEYFKDVLKRQKRIHGEKHPNIADTLHSIGCAQARDGDYQLALKTLEDCYNMRLEFLGMDHPSQATTLHEIAKMQRDRGRLKKAIHICDAALQIRLECLSENHIDVALVMSTKASCLVAKGDFVEANKLFLQALPIAEAAVGPYHPSLAEIHVQIGSMHLRKCHFDEATESIQKALDMYRKSNLDEDHPGIKQAIADLEQVERSEMLCV